MARRRAKLSPKDAKSEGERRLRELLRRQTFGAIARVLRCDESAVRFYARGKRKPNGEMRVRVRAKLGIQESAWDEPPRDDAYETTEPPTRRRREERKPT